MSVPDSSSSAARALRFAGEGVRADDEGRLVRREEMAVVLEDDDVEDREEAVRRVRGHHVDVLRLERLVEEPEVHRPRAPREREGVRLLQARQAVGPVQELVADAEPPARRPPGRRAQRRDPGRARVLAADHHRERVVEAERLEPVELPSRAVLRRDAPEDVAAGGRRGELQDGRGRRARVLGVEVDVARHERLVREERSAEIQLARHGRAEAPLELLRGDLPEERPAP